MTETGIAQLVGETLTEIVGMETGSDRIVFRAQSGRSFVMWHEQDCCESVAVEDVTGRAEDLLHSPIIRAEESSNDGEPKPSEWAESWTWTFYTLATAKGYVTLRWLGESNGYYSESVSFVRADRAR